MSELLQGYKHNNIPGDNSAGIGSDPVIEGHWSLHTNGYLILNSLEDAVKDTFELGVFALWLIHESSFDLVNGLPDHHSNNTGCRGHHKMAKYVIPIYLKLLHQIVFKDELFGLVKSGQFTCVENWISSDIGRAPGPKASYALLSVDLRISVYHSIVLLRHTSNIIR